VRSLLRLLSLAALLVLVAALAPKPTPTPSVRRVAVRYCDGTTLSPNVFGAESAPAIRRGVELRAAPEGTPVPKGADAVHLCVLPAPDAVKALAARFAVELQEHAFAFDGRTYSDSGDAIALSDSSSVNRLKCHIPRRKWSHAAICSGVAQLSP